MAKNQLFKFNLVTPITKEEVQVLEERDNTTVNSFILIFGGVFVFFIMTLLSVVFVEPAISNSQRSLENKQVALNQFNEIKVLNGEFVVKARALSPLLDLDIKPNKLVDIVDNLVTTLQSRVDIESFGRDRDGTFNIQALVPDLDSLNLIKGFFDENEDSVSDLFINEINNGSTGIQVSIVFNILVNEAE